jgi:ribonucleotide reductase alpha subunit
MAESMSMYVLKRNGEREEVSFDKIIKRIQKYAKDLTKVNAIELAQQIIAQIFNGIPTHKIDELTAEICAAKTTTHPDYGKLASRITISNHHKNTSPSYSEVIQLLWDNKDVLGEHCPLINKRLYDMVMEHKNKINATLDYDKDFNYDYFGFKTLERAYLMRINDKIVERPQHLLMRVALSIHKDDVKEALKSYKLMSEGYFTHATPTLFNMGTQREQASSCFLLTVDEDSIDGIYKTIKDCAKISKCAGGIGVAFHKIRAKGSRIRGTNGISNGIVPMLKVFNETARYVDQCFVPGTLIYTLNEPKKIENVTIGDMVLTSSGEYHKVMLPVRHEYDSSKQGNMLNIKLINSKTLVTVTQEHQIMALKYKDCEMYKDSLLNTFNFEAICSSLDKGLLNPRFYDANELTSGDFVVHSVPQYVYDIPQLTEEDCRMYGILLSDAYIQSNLDCQISLSKSKSLSNYSKEDTINFIISYLENRNIKVTLTKNGLDNNKNVIIINWSGINPAFKFTYSQFYDNYKIKRCDTSFTHLPNNKIEQLLKGIFETGGYIITNSHLLENIRYMYLRLGILYDYTTHYNKSIKPIQSIQTISSSYSFTYNDYNTETNMTTTTSSNTTKPTSLTSLTNPSNTTNPTNPKYIFTPIESITKTHYEGVVHDFEIDGPHDYTVAYLGIAHNGGGKRAGSIACYIEPWHADIFDFLKLKSNTGIEEERARDLFYAVWLSDLFMKRVEEDGDWSLMCPDKSPNLYLTYGEEFEKLYTQYEAEGRALKVVKARVVWEAILTSQMETGTPYIGFKDAVNIKNNQKNLGTIQSSNLCHEICEYTSRDEIAVCNLASIPIAKFLEHKDGNKELPLLFNYEKLREVVKQVVKNLNKVIDYNYYPVKEAEYSNRKNRPQGLGISGAADLFAMLKLPFDSDEARVINRKIFENMYYAALECSMETARKRKKFVQEYKRIIKLGSGSGSGSGTGGNPTELSEEDKARLQELKTTHFIIDDELKLPNQYAGAYASFVGSPMSEGKFQFDLWNVEPSPEMKEEWETLRSDIQKHGIRNSLLIALMPTASTSQILGWNECIEPFTNNIYTRKTLAGTFVVVNKYLIQDLLDLGIWNQSIKDKIIMNDGSVQTIPEIPQHIKDLYKTVWEMKQKSLIDLAADRAPFVCQTQSMNLFVKNPTYKTLNAMHFYSWKKGLKTGIYYLRSQAKTSAQKFSVDLGKTSSGNAVSNSSSNTTSIQDTNNKNESKKEPKEEQECLMCSS